MKVMGIDTILVTGQPVLVIKLLANRLNSLHQGALIFA
jgi:hypothetical protein